VVRLYTILSGEATDPDHTAHEYFRDRLRFIADGVTTAFAEAAAAGELRPDVTPAQAAVRLLAMTEGTQLLWLNGFDVDLGVTTRENINSFLTRPI
jgi:hypothetical protein